ncbi:MAG: hypothetical protein E7270_10545 [Lachnospiraceae bacterium]|nr:hypothetical protein [Lachnospiraceae bacterium]
MIKKLLACATAILFFGNNCYVAMAQTMPMEEKRVEENGQVLHSFYNKGERVTISSEFDYDDCGNYEKKVFENEVKNQTGIMDEELEITLNKAGVLDSEIEEMSPETVENLSNATEIQVISSICEERGEEIVEITDEEVEEYYKEYYNENHKNKKSKKNLTDKILESIGVKPIEVYALDTDDYDAYQSAKFKQTLFTCNAGVIDNKPCIYYEYTAQWLSTPKYNRKDYIKFCFTNGTEVKKKTAYRFSYRRGYRGLGKIEFEDYIKTKPTAEAEYIDSTSYRIYVQELPGDDGQEKYKENHYQYDYFDRQKFYIKGYVRMYNTSKDIGEMAINVYYYHQIKPISLDWTGVSIDIKGTPSTGFDINSSTNYESLGSVNTHVKISYK